MTSCEKRDTLFSGGSRGVSGVSGNWSAILEGTSNVVKGSHIMVTASRSTSKMTARAY